MSQSLKVSRAKKEALQHARQARSVYADVKHDTAVPQGVSPEKVGATKTDSTDPKIHLDGWANLITGLGFVNTDKRLSTGFIPDPRLTYTDLTYLYRSDGLAKRTVNLPANDMLRAWYRLEGDTDGKVELRMKELDARKQLKKAIRLARLFGGSLAVLGINDGQTYEKPVNENKIKSIDHIHVFDRWRMTVNTADLYLDPANQRYGLPERYLITPLYGVPFYVHESRVLRFEGEDVTDLIRIQNMGWADSILQAVWDRLRALGETYGNLETILSEFIMGKLTISNLQEMIAAGKEKIAQKRLNYVDMTKHVMNTILLDKEEEYDRISATVTGLGDVTDRIIEAYCAVSGIPVCLLMGRSQAGLSNNESSQVRFYYDKIAGEQQEELLPQLNRLINYINISLGSPLDDEWFVRFEPLWQPTQQEIITQRYQQAQADQIYLNAGVLLPDEVAQSRFGGDQYTHETALSEEHKIALQEGTSLYKDGTGYMTPEEKDERALKQAQMESQSSIAGWKNKQQRGTLFGKDPLITPKVIDKPKQQYKNDASDGIDVSDSGLESLTELKLPKDFYGYIICSGNKLTNHVGAPEIVHGEFVSNHNDLDSLRGSPKVCLDFHCNSCKLKTLVGGPEETYDYHVHNNELTSLEGAPKKLHKDLHAYFNRIASMKGLPEEIGGDLFLSDNQITSLEGMPKRIGGDVDLRNNPKKFTEAEVRAVSEVKGQVRV